METKTTAWLTTITFSLIGIWTFFYRAPIVPELLPQTIFYAVLVLNTFFSIRFYAKIQPKNVSQATIDVILVLTYIVLGLSLGRPVAFVFAALCLFIAAPIKYMLMLGLIPYEALLKRKILIDSQGTALCALVLAGTLAGYAFASAWAFAILFTLANVYLLLIRPMYRL
ncbi:MAG: hypothetical protein Q7S05_05005 [bacterium]|nr:hypothetical protein [bacterium]